MFDLTAGTLDRPFLDKHASASVVSLGSHVIVVGGVIGALLFGVSNELPKVPTMMAFVAELAPPPPPPPPPPAPRAQAETEPPHAARTSQGQTFVAPSEAPRGIPLEAPPDFDDEGGVPGGVAGGIAGGVVGGPLGGMLADAPPLPPPPAARTPKRVGGDIQAPELIYRVEPEYPLIAVRAKVTGMVILEATVDESGAVTSVAVLRSLPLLDNAAIAAVKQWRYQPLLLNGARSPFILTVTLTFLLK